MLGVRCGGRGAAGRLVPEIGTMLVVLLLASAGCGGPRNNLHLVEELPNGFALYRSGKPDRDDVAAYCRLGIDEIAVLAGNAETHEQRYRDACPTLSVVYDEEQEADVPLDAAFLEWFDGWVESARREGRVIAVRCNCGCHRTGRLIAYYQMKYQNLTLEDALAIMYERGRTWWLHGEIEPQVRALADYLAGRRCRQEPRYCVGGAAAADR
jgi:protein-tyrosine phosphatase